MRAQLSVLSSIFLIAAASAIVRVDSALRLAPLPPVPAQHRAAPASNARIVAAYGRLPLSFEANRGQAADAVKFLSRGPGYSLFLTANEAVISLGSHGTARPELVEGSSVPWARSAPVPIAFPSAPSAKSAADVFTFGSHGERLLSPWARSASVPPAFPSAKSADSPFAFGSHAERFSQRGPYLPLRANPRRGSP
jgi:hypothetical protein